MKGVFFFALLFSSFLFAEEFNEVDAVSNATEDIKITGGQAYSDRAVLQTYHKDSYDNHWIGFGLTADLGDTAPVAVTPREQEITLSPLTPNTTYFFKFVGALLSNPDENHLCEGSFTTVAATSIFQNENATTKQSILRVENNHILSSDFQTGDILHIRDLQGKMVFTAFVTSGKGNGIALPKLAAGLYTMEHKRGSTSLAANRVIL